MICAPAFPVLFSTSCSESGNVSAQQRFRPAVAPMNDEAWNVEWGNLRPSSGGMGAWQRVQYFGGSCHKQEQSITMFSGGDEACFGEDEYEPDQTAASELVIGELPSIGSRDHATGECKRCAFFSKGRCTNGKDCSHCHFPHDERRRRNRRKAKTAVATIEDNADYQWPSLEESMKTANLSQTVAQAEDNMADFSGSPVCMPVACSQGFDSLLVFGELTPELQIQGGGAAVSSNSREEDGPSNDEEEPEEEQACGTSAEAFSSLWNDTKETQLVESADSDVQSVGPDDEALQLLEMEALEVEAARLEAEALAAENEAQRLLDEAMAAERDCRVRSKTCMSETVAAFSSYYQDHILPSCGDAYWASLHAQFSSAASTASTVKKQPAVGEAETTASSGEITSDYGGTGNDSTDSAGQTSSSDSDHTSARLSEELCSHRQERRHRQTHRQISGLNRPSKRSPLWPSRVPVVGDGPADGEPKKEKTSWTSLAHARRQAAAKDPEVAVVRQARGILNKLTNSNFETLYTQLVECGIRTATQLEGVIMEIFEKATTQHSFLSMYVELCIKLNSHFEKNPVDGVDFRKVLVGACQHTFEKTTRSQPQVDPSLSYEDRYEIEVKFKTRMLGNLRFVGQLLVHKLLAGKILLAVSEELLSVGDAASIEAAATLLKVAGPSFDRKSWTFLPRLHAIFSMMRCMSKDKAIPMRVRCILKDLIDLRDAGWQN